MAITYGYEFQDHGDGNETYVVKSYESFDFSDRYVETELTSVATEVEAKMLVASLNGAPANEEPETELFELTIHPRGYAAHDTRRVRWYGRPSAKASDFWQAVRANFGISARIAHCAIVKAAPKLSPEAVAYYTAAFAGDNS